MKAAFHCSGAANVAQRLTPEAQWCAQAKGLLRQRERKRVKAQGFRPMNHADYEPGRRFYFRDTDGIEFEEVDYG